MLFASSIIGVVVREVFFARIVIIGSSIIIGGAIVFVLYKSNRNEKCRGNDQIDQTKINIKTNPHLLSVSIINALCPALIVLSSKVDPADSSKQLTSYLSIFIRSILSKDLHRFDIFSSATDDIRSVRNFNKYLNATEFRFCRKFKISADMYQIIVDSRMYYLVLTDSNGLSRRSSTINDGIFSKIVSLNCMILQLAMSKLFKFFDISPNITFESAIPLLFDSFKCARFVALVNSVPFNICNLFAVKSIVCNLFNLMKSCVIEEKKKEGKVQSAFLFECIRTKSLKFG